jgi:hypothetical protein
MSTLALEFNDVDALFNNDSLSDNFTGVAIRFVVKGVKAIFLGVQRGWGLL